MPSSSVVLAMMRIKLGMCLPLPNQSARLPIVVEHVFDFLFGERPAAIERAAEEFNPQMGILKCAKAWAWGIRPPADVLYQQFQKLLIRALFHKPRRPRTKLVTFGNAL
jgi:hypothetical protein